MLSFWPWKGDDTSPASFEKALSLVSSKIAKSNAQLDSLRQKSRRLKVLWTLYTSFAYLLYSIILALGVGWKHWGILEAAAVAGGPLIIFGGRYLFTLYYNYRISSVSSRLEDLQKDRETTIDKLKAATKYNSTQQLLEKYGGASPQTPKQSTKKDQKPSGPGNSNTPKGTPPLQKRTGFAPPPTANIQRDSPRSAPISNAPIHPSEKATSNSRAGKMTMSQQVEPPGFAPNAFPASNQVSGTPLRGEPQWYDRFLDLLMGEDETLPRNRIVLICSQCKLVNGQAPPGTKSLAEVGKWRCSECGSWNGEENEASQIVAEVQKEAKAASKQQDKATDSDEPPTITDPEKPTDEHDIHSIDEHDHNEEISVENDEEEFEDAEEKPQVSDGGRPRRRNKKRI